MYRYTANFSAAIPPCIQPPNTYLFGTGYFKRQFILKQQFTIEKGYYDPVYNTPYSELDGLRVSIIAHTVELTGRELAHRARAAVAHGIS